MVSLVGAGPGKRDYLSIEALRCIKKADVIVYDALISPSILNEAKMDAELIYVGKRADTIYKKQPEINELLVNLALSGKYVVRLKGGDPFIFGRGGEEALALKKSGISYEIVSGISSSYSVPASAGIPVTHRGAASSVHIITGHEHPAKPSEALDFSVIAKEEGTLVFLMGLRSLGNICEKLIKNGKNGETPVAVISKGMTAKQRTVYGNLLTIKDEVRKNNIEAPAIIVVGDVVGVGKQICEWQSKNEKKVLSGKRILVTGSRNMADSLEKEFEQYGGETIAISLVETIPDYSDCDDIFNNLEKYSWFIFTSANGVNIFFDRLRDLRVDIRKLANARFAVVGTSTKKALGKYGLYADFIPSKFTSKILAEELSKELTDKDKILIVRGKQGKNFIEDKFSEMSVEFDKICIYETIQDERRADEVKRICLDVDYIVVTSGSGAIALRDMAGCEHDNIVAIGPVTKRDCEEVGLRVKIVAEEFDARGIVDVIVRDVEKQG
ncbi:MAG: uroporphyrinogen-III C-methyltransferase [Clostridium sp. CAG:12237_41]|nr:MAG: uroporphyrinogen-III C-methyltransferase [Clostridium sp. CAG:12237_41]